MPDPLIQIFRQATDGLRRREAPAEPVALRVEELPERRPYLPCIWLDKDGRPTPALAYQFDGEAEVRNAYVQSHGMSPDSGPAVVYPESAAPALWAAFLAKRAGVVP